MIPRLEEGDFSKELIEFKSEYVVPCKIFKNPNIEIVYGRIFRPAKKIKYIRERITTIDDDFIDLDWSRVGAQTLTLVCPGLEGHSDWSYVRAIVQALNENNSDVVVFNNRGCSGATKKFFFGIGDEADLSLTVDHILATTNYQAVNMVGYSTGGNLVAKYLADKSETVINSRMNKAYIVSPTLHLYSTMCQFALRKNRIYNKFFLMTMLHRLWQHRATYYRPIKFSELFHVTTSQDFYDKFCFHYTGLSFKQYLEDHSAYYHLSKIKLPLRIIYAIDDSFLNQEYYPYQQVTENKYLNMKISEDGGHASFVTFDSRYFWSESQMLEWFEL